jgi:type I restriction enzyme, S subunit
MSKAWEKYTSLDNTSYFDFGNGLWTGKKPPFVSATVIRNTNFTNSGKIDLTNVAVLEVEKKQFDQRKLIQGDIIIERSGGGPKQPVGRVVYFEEEDGNFSFSNFTSRIRVISGQFNPKFVFYFLLYFYEAGRTFELQAHTTGIRNLDFNKYKSIVSLPIIPLPEQRKICYVLSTVQKAIEHQHKLIRHTIELKKAMMQKLFTEGTKGEKQKQTEIGLVPDSWGVTSIEKEKVLMQYGTSVKCDYDVKGVPVLRIPNVLSGKIDITDLKFGNPKSNEINKLKLDKGDLIFVRTNGAKELTGRCAIYSDELKECYYASYLIRIKVNSGIVPEFLNYYTQTEMGKSYLSEKSIRTADGKFNINTGILNNVLFPKPNVNEQKKIASQIFLLERKVQNHQKKKQTLSALFKSLLHELMTGKRRVHELDFETLIKEYRIEQRPLSMVAEI